MVIRGTRRPTVHTKNILPQLFLIAIHTTFFTPSQTVCAMENTALAVGLTIVAATYIFLYALLSITQDAKEPQALANSIPFISPLIRMAKQKEFYIQVWCVIEHLLIILFIILFNIH